MEASEIKNPADLEKFIQQTVDGLISNRNSAQRDKAIVALGEMAVQIYETAKAEKKEIEVDVESAKKWYYNQYAIGADDERSGLYEWFKRMEEYKNQALQSNTDKKYSREEVIALLRDFDIKKGRDIPTKEFDKYIEENITAKEQPKNDTAKLK